MDNIAPIVNSGSLIFAVPIAFAAGILAFLSPCVLPLAPGYISYITGLTGAELTQGRKGTVMSLNPKDLYDVLAINAASASTQLSGLPFTGPIGGVRVALIGGQWVAFPTHEQLEEAVFDMVVAGRVAGDDVAIMMVEAEATERTMELVAGGATAPTEEVVAQGLDASKKFIKALCEAQSELAKTAAKPVGDFRVFLEYEDDVYAAVEEIAKKRGIKTKNLMLKELYKVFNEEKYDINNFVSNITNI